MTAMIECSVERLESGEPVILEQQLFTLKEKCYDLLAKDFSTTNEYVIIDEILSIEREAEKLWDHPEVNDNIHQLFVRLLQEKKPEELARIESEFTTLAKRKDLEVGLLGSNINKRFETIRETTLSESETITLLRNIQHWNEDNITLTEVEILVENWLLDIIPNEELKLLEQKKQLLSEQERISKLIETKQITSEKMQEFVEHRKEANKIVLFLSKNKKLEAWNNLERFKNQNQELIWNTYWWSDMDILKNAALLLQHNEMHNMQLTRIEEELAEIDTTLSGYLNISWYYICINEKGAELLSKNQIYH